jgi:hypothetical protein
VLGRSSLRDRFAMRLESQCAHPADVRMHQTDDASQPSLCRTLLACTLVAAASLADINSRARGAVLNVPEEYVTIQAAVDAAVDGDSVLIAPGLYSGSGNTNVSLLGKRLLVAGRDAIVEMTVIDGAHVDRAFLLQSGEPLGTRIARLTFFQCFEEEGGAISISEATVAIDSCVFRLGGGGRGGGVWVDRGRAAIAASVFEGNNAGEGGGVATVDSDLKIAGSVFFTNVVAVKGGAISCERSRVTIEQCTFVGNLAATDGSVLAAYDGSTVALSQSILVANVYRAPFGCSGSAVVVTCTDSFGNVGGDWSVCLPNQAGMNGNISVDPLFCGSDDLSLQADSPCLPGNHPNGASCGLIGALGAGCGFPNAVQQRTWGRLKGRFSR